MRQKKTKSADIVFDEEIHNTESNETNPEILLLNEDNVQLVKQMLEKLPPEYREIVILREMEGFSYKEIAGISNIPIGTVMSRLARARKFLQKGVTNNKFDKD